MGDALQTQGLTVAIGRITVLHDVDLRLPRGTTSGLIGRNGAGKTSLMRTVVGLLRPKAGTLRLGDAEALALPAHRRARAGVGYMPEDRRLVPQLTAEENILLPVWATRREALRQRLSWIYDLVPELRPLADRKAVALSGGQQKLVALARALVYGTELLLLDEPFEGVAPALAGRLAEVIRQLRNEGLTVLVSESDYTHTASIVERVYVIERGVVESREPVRA